MIIAYNRFPQKQTRRILRQSSSQPEILLWSKLRGRRLGGLKFRRQYSIGPYIVDFYNPEYKIAIEVDGESHFVSEASVRRDMMRKKYITSYEIRFLRFTNKEVSHNIVGVMQNIDDAIRSRTSPSPSLVRRG